MPIPASEIVSVRAAASAVTHRQVAQLAGVIARRSQRFQLLRGIHRIGHEFPQEYFMVGIEEFFNDGEDILGSNPDFSVLHMLVFLLFRSDKQKHKQYATPSCLPL